jgi:hypothetical protein
MSIEEEARDAFEWSARALYEENKGAGAWTNATTQERGSARQSIRVVLAMLEKHGVTFTVRPAKAASNPASKPESKPEKFDPPMW